MTGYRHGYFGTKTYEAWSSMVQRCHNHRHPAFYNYGARGIIVCPTWRADFLSFLADMGEAPAGLTLDRINCDGPYSPDNCRWATTGMQSVNKRNTRFITAFGERKACSEWVKDPRCAVGYAALHGRIHKRGWASEAAITEPSSPLRLKERSK